jgi:hypothetical protein
LHPLRRLLAKLGLELDLENTVLEDLLVFREDLFEGEVDTKVGATPVISSARTAIPVVLSDESELGIERDTHTGVTRELEGRAVVE